MPKKIKKKYDRIIDCVAVLLLVILTYVSFHQVIARFIFSNPPAWTEELARYTFIWVTFLGVVIAFRTAAHLGVDYFVSLLPEGVMKVSSILTNVILICILIVLGLKGIELVQMLKHQLSPVLRISMSYPYLAIPVGMFLSLIEVIWSSLVRIGKKGVN